MVQAGDKVRLILDVPVRAVFSDGLQIGTDYNSAVILHEWIKLVELIPPPCSRCGCADFDDVYIDGVQYLWCNNCGDEVGR